MEILTLISLLVSDRIFYVKSMLSALIIGKGLHSSGGIAKLKPAIEELIQRYVDG